jgi:hypothetical protein
MLRAACAAAALAVMSVASASAAPLLVNGSLTGQAVGGFSQVPSGWTAVTPTPDTSNETYLAHGNGLHYTYVAAVSASPDGGTWVGMVGMPPSFSESIGQTVSGFTIGNSYTLSWYHANFGLGVDGTPGFIGPGAIEVLANGVSIGSGERLYLGSDWVEESITFVAKDADIALAFKVLVTDPDAGDMSYQSIDGIRLVDAVAEEPEPTDVPEPASLSLFAGAGVALLVARRRRRQAKRAV